MTMLQRLTYTVEEAGDLLGISRGSAYNLVRTGQFPALRNGSKASGLPRRAQGSPWAGAAAPREAARATLPWAPGGDSNEAQSTRPERSHRTRRSA